MANSEKTHFFKLGTKVGDRHIDGFINDFAERYKTIKKKNEQIIFDISNVEWFSNQELLVLTGLFKYLLSSGNNFKVQFRNTSPGYQIDVRKALQFIQIWDVWKIYKIVPNKDINQYFDIDNRFIDSLKVQFNLRSTRQEIYERYGITPFLELERIQNYEDRKIREIIDSIYRLNDATNEILIDHNCFVPIQNRTLNAIITKELYENFLDHYQTGLFDSKQDYSFMSISLRTKFKSGDSSKVQYVLKRNFADEYSEGLHNFFYDKSKKQFKNQSYLELSFLDFGVGIPTTLRKAYEAVDKSSFSEEHFKNIIDTRILEYAFRFDSSQHPMHERYANHIVLPRGLFDLLSIVRRFEGLLIARSNYGKLAYDFSDAKTFSNAITYFGDESLFFPGTLISIYLPERTLGKEFDASKIKPIEDLKDFTFAKRETKFLSLYDLQQKVKSKNLTKDKLYDSLLELLSNTFSSDDNQVLYYLDFDGYEIDERVSKKILYFLISDYRLNIKSNVVIINPPPKSYLDNIQKELIDLSDIDKKFKIHPTPFVFLNETDWTIDIYWLGVFSEIDLRRLSNLLFDIHDLRKSDFENPLEVVGHINYYDSHGNLKSLINSREIIEVYKKTTVESRRRLSADLIKKYLKQYDKSVFLCNGNYYQKIYIQLFDALSNVDECEYLSKALYSLLKDGIRDLQQFKFLSITASSQKILQTFIKFKFISESDCVILDNYHGFIDEPQFESRIASSDKVILVCDVVSTGYMIQQVYKGLNIRGAHLEAIAVLVNAIDKDFEPSHFQYESLVKKVYALLDLPIKKVRREKLKERLVDGSLKVIRINPFTNTPIIDDLEKSNYKDSVLLSNDEFIGLIKTNDIKVGYFKFNNLIHPYFFNTNNILADSSSSFELLKKIFERIGKTAKDIEIIFYPKNSGIKYLDTKLLTDRILLNQRIEFLELERFSTSEGWRFPHPAEYMKRKATGKKAMILDDGSCTGDSIVQMIDEVAFLGVKEIVVLSIIGRVNDHKREFFSRLSAIDNGLSGLKLKIYFGCHWSIPTYYVEDSPVVLEKRWLDNIIAFPNTPKRIKEIARVVLNELTPKEISSENNKQLLKERNGAEISKDLVLIREEIGRITSYRFYSSYFDFFNNFISKYESNEDTVDRYKTIELICAVFLHEPYLFNRIKNVLPDLVDKIEEFTLTITTGNPKKQFRRIEKHHLHFDWKNKDIIHLFFIVFKDTRLVEVLDVDRLEGIIKIFGKNSTDLNYILFKLLRYLPLHREIITEKKYSGMIIQLIENVKERIDSGQNNSIKLFTSYLSTLPYRVDDFNSHLNKIKNNYSKLKKDQHHNEYIFNDKQVLITQLRVLYKKKLTGLDFENERAGILNAWSNISSFVEELLRFSVLYPDFFIPHKEGVGGELLSEQYLLRDLFGKIQEIIYSEDLANAEDAITYINELFSRFIMDASRYPLIFDDTSIRNIKIVFNEFISELKTKHENIRLKIVDPPNVSINFPLFFFKDIVFKEINENMRHATLDEEVDMIWEDENDMLKILIRNRVKMPIEKKGGAKGLDRLNKLNDFPIPSEYTSSEKEGYFEQILKFKKL